MLEREELEKRREGGFKTWMGWNSFFSLLRKACRRRQVGLTPQPGPLREIRIGEEAQAKAQNINHHKSELTARYQRDQEQS